MSENIESTQVTEKEKQVIISIQEDMGYLFNIIELNKFLYALPPIFYPFLAENVIWPPDNEFFEFYDDANIENWLSITIDEDHIIGISIGYDPRISLRISKLPNTFKDLKFLKYLIINFHYIRNLDQILPYLTNLEFLSLDNSRLNYKEGIFKDLKKLIGLDLSDSSRETDLIKEICNIFSLKVLDLSNSRLDSIPNCFQKLENLKSFSISYRNNFQFFPKNLNVIKNLEHLNCYESGIEVIQEDIKLPNSLKTIDLKNNRFIDLPLIFENLPDLEKIEVDSDVIANYIRNTKENLAKEMQRGIKSINFTDLYKLTQKKLKFIKLLRENRIELDLISYIYKDLIPPLSKVLDPLSLEYEEEKEKILNLAETLFKNDLEDIKIYFDDLEWISINQVTIREVKLKDNEIEKTINLSRLSIFIGKNNTGKTYALNHIYAKLGNITKIEPLDLTKYIRYDSVEKYDIYSEGLECFYIPKYRILDKPKQKRKGYKEVLKDLEDCLNDLRRASIPYKIKNIVNICDFFNSNSKEILEFGIENQDFFKIFRVILKKWIFNLNKFFPDIGFKPPERIDLNTSVEFSFDDNLISNMKYNLNQLGSGTQELISLIFAIELLKYLPKIKSQTTIEKINKIPPPRILFIDEFEISLHPSLQSAFFDYLIDASKRVQIIIATQSPNIPEPVENIISVILFKKEKNGFIIEEITKNNRILILDEMFDYDPLETAFFLSKNNYFYFKEINYDSEEFTMGKFLKNRYKDVLDYSGLLKLGTVYENINNRLLQNSCFLCFSPDTIDLMKEEEIFIPLQEEEKLDPLQMENKTQNHLEKIILFQFNKISMDERKRLIKRCEKRKKKEIKRKKDLSNKKQKLKYKNLRKKLYKDNLDRFLTFWRDCWNEKKMSKLILSYNNEQEDKICQKIKDSLKDIQKNKIELGIEEYRSLILFPENTLPYKILNFLIKFAEDNKIVIIGGMEHHTVKEIKYHIDLLEDEKKDKYSNQILYSQLKSNENINDETYINQAVIINADRNFTFQIKNTPVYYNALKKHEGIPIILQPTFRKFKTDLGNLAVFICKDFLVNYEIIDIWMEINDIKLFVVPSFTELVNPFRNKFGEIVSKKSNRDKIFIFANVAEYGGSGIYNFSNRREYEPGKDGLFALSDEEKKSLFRPNKEGCELYEL